MLGFNIKGDFAAPRDFLQLQHGLLAGLITASRFTKEGAQHRVEDQSVHQEGAHQGECSYRQVLDGLAGNTGPEDQRLEPSRSCNEQTYNCRTEKLS